MKILFLSRWFPYPANNGSKIRIFNLIKQLSLRHQIDLISFASESVTDEQIIAMRSYCQRVEVARYNSFQPDRLKALLGFLSWQPRSFIDTHSVEMQRLVEEATNRTKFDLVIASEIDSVPYALVVEDTPKNLG